jgi:hypothetical protein
VPVGWHTTVRFRNAGSRAASCAVVQLGQANPAFPGAATPSLLSGLPSGAQASFSFVPTRAGVYRLASLVPGEQEGGMWDGFEVVSGGMPALVRLRP